MPNLVGIGNSQVPTNAMLGGMAYQNPTNVTIQSLNATNISKIKAETNDTAIGLFVYNTANDFDGGLWRRRCKGTSWFNEPASTYRGSRKDFPAIAVIVGTNSDIIIYDGDDPNLSMWMTFPSHGYISWATSSNLTQQKFSAKNGIIAHASNDGGGLIKFIDDYYETIYASTTYPLIQDRNIAARTQVSGYISASDGANRRHYVVDHYSYRGIDLSGSYEGHIDPRNGLPFPDVLVATIEGVSLIRGRSEENTDLNSNNGARGQDHDSFTPYIIQRINDSGGVRECQDPVFRSDTHFSYYNSSNGTVQNHFNWANTSSSTTNIWKYNYWDYGGHSTNENITALRIGASGSYRSAYRRLCGDRNDPSKLYVGGSMALSIVQDRHDRDYSDDSATIFDSKVCYIASTFNTGWLYGDVRAALLMSTESVADQPYKTTNYLPQGNFSDASQWTLGTGWSISGGQAVHNGSGAGYITSTFSPSLTSHKWYVCIVDFVSGTMGSGSSGFGIVNHNNGSYNTPQTERNFTGSTSYADVYFKYTPIHNSNGGHRGIGIWQDSTGQPSNANFYSSGGAVTIDNIIVKEVDPTLYGRELSPSYTTGYPIVNIGNPTREPCNEGCDLQCWTGFTNNDFLVQPARQRLDYGNSQFYYMFWLMPNNSENGDVVFTRSGIAGGNNGRFMCYFNDDKIRVDMTEYGGSSYYGMLSNQHRVRQKREWMHFCFVRTGGDGGGQLQMYINGQHDSSHTLNSNSNGTQSGNEISGIGVLYIGADANTGNPLDKGKITLFRTGKREIPSDEIAQIYADELPMFSPHTKCSLYGGSDAADSNVNGVAHDQNTGILHVGTSAGRSDFDGFVRINNTTDGITQTISAAGGVVVEE